MVMNNETIDQKQSGISLAEISDTSSLDDPLWTVEDVADYLQLQPETIRSMARRGELPALKLGKVWRFYRHAIHEMLINMH